LGFDLKRGFTRKRERRRGGKGSGPRLRVWAYPRGGGTFSKGGMIAARGVSSGELVSGLVVRKNERLREFQAEEGKERLKLNPSAKRLFKVSLVGDVGRNVD